MDKISSLDLSIVMFVSSVLNDDHGIDETSMTDLRYLISAANLAGKGELHTRLTNLMSLVEATDGRYYIPAR